ncbi:MAG: DNA recombination protein RmuC, partial [Bacteroidales bacterium]|nr:DNA recombination protein RmuC [Bacteroidales bacterium]
MAKKIEKTNAARLLDKAGISYKLIPYEFDENDLAAQYVADSLGQDIARVFKTLVLHGDRTGHIVCVVAGNGEADPMLWQEAYRKGVLIATEQTIMPFLKIMQLTWNKFQHDTNTQKITAAAQNMIDRVASFY